MLKRKARPDKRGQRSFWKKFEVKAQGRRVGQINERGKMKTKRRDFPHLWERLRQQQYQLKLANGRRWSAEGAADSFKNALEDEISSLKTRGESCSPSELCRIHQGERRLENLKKKANWNIRFACAKYELQIVSESTRLAAEECERKIDEERRKIDGEARERAKVAERRWHEALAKVAAMRKCSPREVDDAPRKRGGRAWARRRRLPPPR